MKYVAYNRAKVTLSFSVLDSVWQLSDLDSYIDYDRDPYFHNVLRIFFTKSKYATFRQKNSMPDQVGPQCCILYGSAPPGNIW